MNMSFSLPSIFENVPCKNSNNQKFAEFSLVFDKRHEESQKRCLICLEAFQNNDYVGYLPCIHIFHKKCIDEWVKSKKTCPLCMNRIDEGFTKERK